MCTFRIDAVNKDGVRTTSYGEYKNLDEAIDDYTHRNPGCKILQAMCTSGGFCEKLRDEI